MRTVYVDTRQQAGKHERKHAWFEGHACALVPRKLDVGDYMLEGVPYVSVDTKRDVDEIAANIGGRNHRRFREECKRAQSSGVQLFVLVENLYGFEAIRDLFKWTNTHCKTCRVRYQRGCNPRGGGKCPKHGTRKPIQGPQLARAMVTMSRRYGVKFEFCHPNEAGARVLEILEGGTDYESC